MSRRRRARAVAARPDRRRSSPHVTRRRVRAATLRRPPSPRSRYTLGLDDPHPPLRGSQPSAVRARVHRAWRTYFSGARRHAPRRRGRRGHPLGRPGAARPARRARRARQGPLLFVCPSRPDLRAARPGVGRRSAQRLGGLARSAPADEADAARRAPARRRRPAGDGPRARILERAEGNPFFLEEILRRLIDEGRSSARATAGVRRPASRSSCPTRCRACSPRASTCSSRATSAPCSRRRSSAASSGAAR